MDNKEKIIEALAKIDYASLALPKQVFSKEQYKLFEENGLTKKEIAQLEEAEVYSQLIDLLPNDAKGVDRMMSALDAVSNANPEINKKHLILIAQKDPQMLVQLLALAELLEQ